MQAIKKILFLFLLLGPFQSYGGVVCNDPTPDPVSKNDRNQLMDLISILGHDDTFSNCQSRLSREEQKQILQLLEPSFKSIPNISAEEIYNSFISELKHNSLNPNNDLKNIYLDPDKLKQTKLLMVAALKDYTDQKIKQEILKNRFEINEEVKNLFNIRFGKSLNET